MRIERLRAKNLRCFASLEFQPASGINWLVGPNGAGKTTLLEAAYLLAHGSSFRPGSRTAPCRYGEHEYLVRAEVLNGAGELTKLGLTRSGDGWQGRRNGVGLVSLGPLFEACPVVCFGPESQLLVMGPAEERRSYLDWNVFHVEHGSLALWRDWRRALRQRNALLRAAAPDAAFEPWERALAELAAQIDRARRACLVKLEPYLVQEAAALVPELGRARLDYRSGWDTRCGLMQQLAEHRARDRERKFTHHGAHRADWSLIFERVASREHLSRGQAKAIALACVLAQARWLKDQIGEFPLVCVDDLYSELDAAHADKVVGWLANQPVQAWITSTHPPDSAGRGATQVFHVKHDGVKLWSRKSPYKTLYN